MTPAFLGQGAVLLGFLAATIGALTLAVGLVKDRPVLRASANRFTWLVVGAAVFAVAVMERALLTDDFSLVFVAEHSARATPLLYKIATMWSALEGSIRQATDGIRFEIISAGETVPVRFDGNEPPELFKEGIPVVLEGRWDGDVYASDQILVKHTSEYREQNPERVDDYVGKTDT